MTKCARTACNAEGLHPHRDLPGLYCTPCGRRINHENGVALVFVVPPSVQPKRAVESLDLDQFAAVAVGMTLDTLTLAATAEVTDLRATIERQAALVREACEERDGARAEEEAWRCVCATHEGTIARLTKQRNETREALAMCGRAGCPTAREASRPSDDTCRCGHDMSYRDAHYRSMHRSVCPATQFGDAREASGPMTVLASRDSTPACPEHGDGCIGADCCCADLHPGGKNAPAQPLTVLSALADERVRRGEQWVRWEVPSDDGPGWMLLRRDTGTPGWMWVWESDLRARSSDWDFFEFDVEDLDAECTLVAPDGEGG